MRDISLHILDIAENSVKAGAKNIEIKIEENDNKDFLSIEITDDGQGMKQDMAEKVTDPFVTTRTTRKVGMGLPLLKASAEQAEGSLTIDSVLGKGTKIKAVFKLSHIDRKPLGNMTDTIIALVMFNSETNIKYIHKRNNKEFIFDSKNFNNNGNSTNNILYIKKYLQKNNLIQ
jgi:anti-sigma regulatory factor (Ser/Thr protein kinase)